MPEIQEIKNEEVKKTEKPIIESKDEAKIKNDGLTLIDGTMDKIIDEAIAARETDAQTNLNVKEVEIQTPKEISDLLQKYKPFGWVSKEGYVDGNRELKIDEIAVSEQVRGPDPVYKYEDGLFYPVNYGGKPMDHATFEKYIRNALHRKGAS